MTTPRQDAIVAAYESGFKVDDIADTFKIHRTTVQRIMRRHHAKRRHHGRTHYQTMLAESHEKRGEDALPAWPPVFGEQSDRQKAGARLSHLRQGAETTQ